MPGAERRALSLAALSAGYGDAALALQNPVATDPSVDCWMNSSQQTRTTRPRGKRGFEITFSRGASFRSVPAGPPTTDRRPMRDEQGRLWLMSGQPTVILSLDGKPKKELWIAR